MRGLDKVIGYEAIKQELRRYVDILRNPEKYARLGVSFPSGIMLFGEPGVGKTMMAKCFIDESGCKAFTLRKDKPNGDLVNEIRKTFEAAKAISGEPVIVFLDDLDKFANEDYMHCDAEEYVTVQSCIDDCKGRQIFVLATVNDIYFLPMSLRRAGRFDKEIEVGIPHGDDANKIIEHFLQQKHVGKDVDAEEICRLLYGETCAELEAIVNEAGIYAAYEGKSEINQADLIKACARRKYDTSEDLDQCDEALVRTVAVHEAGHVIVAEVLDPGSVAYACVGMRDGAMEGNTKRIRPRGCRAFKELRERGVIYVLAGKAATEMVFGLSDMGCRADIHEAFLAVSELVESVCTVGFEAYNESDPSGYVLERRDRLVAFEMERYYQMAKRIIAENRAFLDAVTDALVDRKTLTYRELAKIKEQAVGAK